MKNEKKDIRKTVAVVVIIVFVMFTLSFALVPLSNVIRGISGTNATMPGTGATAGTGSHEQVAE
jgi:cytochrome c oxidase assembly protein Cox11